MLRHIPAAIVEPISRIANLPSCGISLKFSIAAELNMRESTVKSILRRTRAKLHEQLEKEELL